MRIVVFGWLILSQAALFAQNVTGRVLDKTTGEPMQFATVYFSQTLIGTTTDQNGNFTLKNIDPGKYNLIATYVGYRSLPLEIEIKAGENYEVILHMTPEAVRLREVEITASNEDREIFLDYFRKAFIGYSKAAQSCKILNEDEIIFHLDEYNNLNAYLERPVEVLNKELGYKVYYDLYDFQYNLKTSYLRMYGIPRFENIREKTKRKWVRSRKRSYEGSLLHFFNSITKDSSYRESFKIKRLTRIPNEKRLPDSVLRAKLRYFFDKNDAEKFQDSINFYTKNQRLPRYKDIVGNEHSLKSIVNRDGNKYYLKGGAYYIEHLTQLIKPVKGFWVRPSEETISRLFIMDEKLTIYPNGYVEDASRIYVEGYWAWSEKVGNMLPLSYNPQD